MVSLASIRAGLGAAFAGGDAGGMSGATASRAFQDAARHSARVRFLRKAIPIACAAAVAMVMVVRFLNPFRGVDADVSVSSVALSGSKLTMEQPKLSGFKKDAKAYEVVASSAVQDIRKPNIVDLVQPVARIEMQRGSWTRLSAVRGNYDATTEKLRVDEAVNIKTDTGFEMRLSYADVDFKAGLMQSNAPVEVVLPNGWIKADRLTVLDNGKVAVFEGNVKSEFIDAGSETDAAKPGPSTTP